MTAPPSTLCEQYIHVFLNEVTVLVPVLNETKHSFALYTPERTRQRWPVRLAATTEQDMNDWVSGHTDQAQRAAVSGKPGLGLPAAPLPTVTHCLPTPACPA